MWNNNRSGGILLHPTSLPSQFGIGDLGNSAYLFIDFLYKYKQRLWQVLPLGITGYGDSPYSSFSSYAGNPFLISPEKLIEVKLLSLSEIEDKGFPQLKVDYGIVIPYKWELLKQAFHNFSHNSSHFLHKEFVSFQEKQKHWLDDFALFMTIKESNNFKPWNIWEDSLKYRQSKALDSWTKVYHEEILFQKFVQFIFFKQWSDLRNYANQRNIRIIGDIPIFVAFDSTDVWANPSLFILNKQREMTYIAGVPPDYFSTEGQRWGNPLYRWDVHKRQKYRWWFLRILHSFSFVDILRIDHFRGFEAYWRIPTSEPTTNGNWISGPGYDFFKRLKQRYGILPIIAEDLGVITTAVELLLQKTGFPGMCVLQFAFGGFGSEYFENRYLPHNYTKNCIIYTGTHDNDTTKSWFESAPSEVQDHVLNYLKSNGKDITGDLIRLAWASVANMSVIPLQDLLRLNTEGRMNLPGRETGNWQWRFKWDQLTPEYGEELETMSKLYGR